MIWAYPDSQLTLVLGIVFGLLYSIYLFRFWRINRKLKVKLPRLFFKLGLRLTYFVLFLVALSGPSLGNAMKEITQEGKDIFIAIDLSQSMNAEDISPSRIQRVKFELQRLVRNFSSDRIGLIIFSSEAFIQCPLTYDQNVIQLHLDGLNTGLVPNKGTDLAAPLALALKKFQTDENREISSKSLILISDGEDFGGDLSNILEEYNQAGVTIFSLGIGTERGSTVPMRSGIIMDPKTGTPVISRLESTKLKRLAAATSGTYFEISDEMQEIPQLIAAIEQLEGAVMGTRMVEASANKYFYFLLAGLALALLDMMLPMRTLSI